MKKLNLNLGSIKEMFTKEQMKRVIGGGYDECSSSNPCSSSADWCVNGKCEERPLH